MSENKSILQALRKNVGKTQEQVAEYMDVATNTIQNWERTPSQIKEEQLCKLLDFYHATQKERKDIVLQIHRNVLCIGLLKSTNTIRLSCSYLCAVFAASQISPS